MVRTDVKRGGGKKRNISGGNNDFKRRKAKVGRKLQRANLTDTSFKAASIKVPSQGHRSHDETSAASSEAAGTGSGTARTQQGGRWSDLELYAEHPETDTEFDLHHYLSLCHHHNVKARKESIRVLSLKLHKAPKMVRANLAKILDTTVKVIMDVEPGVRRKALGLYYTILLHVQMQDIQAFVPILVIHFKAALCKIQPDIRVDTLAFLVVLISLYPNLLEGFSDDLCVVLLQLLSSEQLTVVSRSLVEKFLPTELGFGETIQQDNDTERDVLHPPSTSALSLTMESMYSSKGQHKSMTSLESRVAIVWVLGLLLRARDTGAGKPVHEEENIDAKAPGIDISECIRNTNGIGAIRFATNRQISPQDILNQGKALDANQEPSSGLDNGTIMKGCKALFGVWQECAPSEAHSHNDITLMRMKLVLDVLRCLLCRKSDLLDGYLQPNVPDVESMSLSEIKEHASKEIPLPNPWDALRKNRKSKRKEWRRRYHESTTPGEEVPSDCNAHVSTETTGNTCIVESGFSSNEIVQEIRSRIFNIFPCQSSSIGDKQRKKKGVRNPSSIDSWNALNLSIARLFSLFLPRNAVGCPTAHGTDDPACDLPSRDSLKDRFYEWSEAEAQKMVMSEQQLAIMNPSEGDIAQNTIAEAAGVVVGYGKGSQDVSAVLSKEQQQKIEKARGVAHKRAEMLSGWYIARIKKRRKQLQGKLEWLPKVVDYLFACLYSLGTQAEMPKDIRTIMREASKDNCDHSSLHRRASITTPTNLLWCIRDYIAYEKADRLPRLLWLMGEVFQASVSHSTSRKQFTELMSQLFQHHLYKAIPNTASKETDQVIPHSIAARWLEMLPRTLWQVGSKDIQVSQQILSILGSIPFYQLDNSDQVYDDIIKKCIPVLYATRKKGNSGTEPGIFGPFFSWPKTMKHQFLCCLFKARVLNDAMMKGLRITCYSEKVQPLELNFIITNVVEKIKASKPGMLQFCQQDEILKHSSEEDEFRLHQFLLSLVFGCKVDISEEGLLNVPEECKSLFDNFKQNNSSEVLLPLLLPSESENTHYFRILWAVSRQIPKVNCLKFSGYLIRGWKSVIPFLSSVGTPGVSKCCDAMTLGIAWLMFKCLPNPLRKVVREYLSAGDEVETGAGDFSPRAIAHFLSTEVAQSLLRFYSAYDLSIELLLSDFDDVAPGENNSHSLLQDYATESLGPSKTDQLCRKRFTEWLMKACPPMLTALLRYIKLRFCNPQDVGGGDLSLTTLLSFLRFVLTTEDLHDLRVATESRESHGSELASLDREWKNVISSIPQELKMNNFDIVSEIENNGTLYGLLSTA